MTGVAATLNPLDTALALAASGLSVLPIKPDGTKSPAIASWGEYQTRIATADEIRTMFRPGLGVAIAAGTASGNLEVLDIEAGAPFAEFCELIHEHAPDLLGKLPHVETPSGGHHLFYRCDEIAGNQKLAMRVNDGNSPEVIFETRGRGGYVVTISSPPACHEEQREYRLVHGRLTQIPRILPAERALLLDAARSFNQVVRKAQVDHKPPTNGNRNGSGTARPGDVFNERTTWAEVLEPHEWIAVSNHGEETLWRRPGKVFSFSATTNYRGSDLFYCFSTNAHPFEHETSYSKFAAYALLSYGGDYKAAARAIAQKFGMKDERITRGLALGEAEEERAAIQHEGISKPELVSGQDVALPPTHWKWLDVSKLSEWQCLPLRWNIQDLIAQGNFVIVAAETQTGKTLFGLFLSRSMQHAGQLFGKLEIRPVEKILYLGLEDPDRRFKDRLQDIEASFPPIAEGRFIVHIAPGFSLNDERMIQYLESLITKYGFNVVFLDTYQKATPGLSSFGDEEQSAILHRLSDLTRIHDVTLIVMDHVRKRDGQQKKKNVLTIDDIKGTGGKAQNADCVILMERTPDRKQVRFQSFSKDSDQPIRILLDVAPKGSSEPKFKYAGDLDQLAADAKAQGSANLSKVLSVFPDDPGVRLSSSTVAERCDLSPSTTRRHLASLVKSGKLDSAGEGRSTKYWRISDESAQEAI